MFGMNSGFWRYKIYADIRSGFQDLCKFSLDLRTLWLTDYIYMYGIKITFVDSC